MLILNVRPGGRYLDGTLGGGTHSAELLRRSSPNGQVLSLDVDKQALVRARERLSEYGERWRGVEGNFRHLVTLARAQGLEAVDGIILDLGFSSDQIEDPSKGLSFLHDGPLDMRLGPSSNDDGLTAADIVNSWTEREIEEVIREYGEERFAKRIAHAIVQARKAARFVGTFDLTTVIRHAVPTSYERGRIHPATRTFQALRIAVNDELGALREAIASASRLLAPGGRIAIITFHSLEDRLVKNLFRTTVGLERVTKKPIVPQPEEIAINPRARSAKLRAAQKIA